MNSLFIANWRGVSRIHYQFTNSKVTLNSPSISRFHNEFICFANIHYLSRRFSSMYLLLISQIYYRFTVCFAYSLSFWRIYLKFCDSLWIFAKSIWIHYFSREFIMNSVCGPRIQYLFRDSTIISLSVPRIRYLFRENAMNLLSFPLLHYEFTVYVIQKQ